MQAAVLKKVFLTYRVDFYSASRTLLGLVDKHAMLHKPVKLVDEQVRRFTRYDV
jgi:hypothetical protein